MATDAHTPDTAQVLVIDDEDYVADMIASALELEGYTTYVAYNGRDGLARAQQLTVDLVIIDIMMPYIDGLTLVATLRTLDHLRTVPIMLISAGARPRQPLPRVRFIAKPFDMDQLTQHVADDLAAAKEAF